MLKIKENIFHFIYFSGKHDSECIQVGCKVKFQVPFIVSEPGRRTEKEINIKLILSLSVTIRLSVIWDGKCYGSVGWEYGLSPRKISLYLINSHHLRERPCSSQDASGMPNNHTSTPYLEPNSMTYICTMLRDFSDHDKGCQAQLLSNCNMMI